MQSFKDYTKNDQNLIYSNEKMAEMLLSVPKAIFGVIHQTSINYEKDTSQLKVNLSVGAYKDENGLPYVFQVVRKAQEQLIKNIDKEYIKDNFQGFSKSCQRIIFCKNCSAIDQQRIATIQTLSGTGALYFGFQFISKYLKHVPKIVYLSTPSWVTHPDIIKASGFQIDHYPYYDSQTKGINFPKMIDSFKCIEEGSIVVLQTAGHNPTGCDPTQIQWKQICEVMKQRNLIPFFDPAYQGFATGDLEKDAWPIRYFLDQGFFMFVAQSFSKNMGLYGDRIGALHVITPNKQSASNILTAIRSLTRKVYLYPPSHGAYIVDRIVSNQQTYENWVQELRDVIASRILKMRKLFRQQLENINTPGNWKHITDQTGMFTYTGLTQKECNILIEKYHIYLITDGRIAVSGLTQRNYQYVAKSIKLIIQQCGQ